MVRFSNFYGGTYLKADDIPSGQDLPVEIAKVSVEQLDDGDKLAVHFAGKQKAMVLNKTNGGVLCDAFGDDADTWIGKAITLYRDRTMFGGKMVDCLRLRVTAPPIPPQPTSAPVEALAEVPVSASEDTPF
jgi:hypothetical protein